MDRALLLLRFLVLVHIFSSLALVAQEALGLGSGAVTQLLTPLGTDVSLGGWDWSPLGRGWPCTAFPPLPPFTGLGSARAALLCLPGAGAGGGAGCVQRWVRASQGALRKRKLTALAASTHPVWAGIGPGSLGALGVASPREEQSRWLYPEKNQGAGWREQLRGDGSVRLGKEVRQGKAEAGWPRR